MWTVNNNFYNYCIILSTNLYYDSYSTTLALGSILKGKLYIWHKFNHWKNTHLKMHNYAIPTVHFLSKSKSSNQNVLES